MVAIIVYEYIFAQQPAVIATLYRHRKPPDDIHPGEFRLPELPASYDYYNRLMRQVPRPGGG